MANVIAIATARGKSGGMNTESECNRLGSESATAHANSWNTTTETHVEKDGSGYALVKRRDNRETDTWYEVARIEWSAEGKPLVVRGSGKIVFDSEERGNVVRTRLQPRADKPADPSPGGGERAGNGETIR